EQNYRPGERRRQTASSESWSADACRMHTVCGAAKLSPANRRHCKAFTLAAAAIDPRTILKFELAGEADSHLAQPALVAAHRDAFRRETGIGFYESILHLHRRHGERLLQVDEFGRDLDR